MKLSNVNLKALLPILIMGIISIDLFSQNAGDEAKALVFYNQGISDLKDEKIQDALENLKSSYSLFKHAEIAYAICHVYSRINQYDEMKKFAKLALNGSPELSNDLEKDALNLLNWKEPSYSAKADHAGPPRTTEPGNGLTKSGTSSNDEQLRGIYSIQQKSNLRYIDAHESSQNDFALVTRPYQNNTTQIWILMPLGSNTYTIQQKSNRRYVDAHENSEKDWAIVTRQSQNNDSQRWIIKTLGNNSYTIQQKSSSRYMDAHESSQQDYSIVTRPTQNNDTQKWLIKPR